MYDGCIDAIIQCEVIMANESMGLLGYKVGMTQIYNSNNAVIPVTVINVSSNTVLQVKSEISTEKNEFPWKSLLKKGLPIESSSCCCC